MPATGKAPARTPPRRLAADVARLAKATPAVRDKAQSAFVVPLQIDFAALRDYLDAATVTKDNLPPKLQREWLTPAGQARVEAAPTGDANNTQVLREFARAILATYANAVGGPISIVKSGDTVVAAFIQAGLYALVSIALLLWIVLRRFGDVLLTLVPLLLAGVATLELCVLIGLPLNFANIIALPLLLGVGVAFKIYYIMAWRAGHTNLLAIEPHPRGHLERPDHGDGIREPVVVEAPGHVQHGPTDGAVACLHAVRCGAVSACTDGKTARRQIRFGKARQDVGLQFVVTANA